VTFKTMRVRLDLDRRSDFYSEQWIVIDRYSDGNYCVCWHGLRTPPPKRGCDTDSHAIDLTQSEARDLACELWSMATGKRDALPAHEPPADGGTK
jgi:hypothetical protein